MKEIEILYQNSGKIFESLSHGQVDAIEEAVDQITDEFMIYGLRGGLIDKLSRSFPDPRREEEISTAFAKGYTNSQHGWPFSRYVCHSNRFNRLMLCIHLH
jgi:hypothetical protein